MINWRPGQKINKGRFIIQGKPLGSGGFGITYKALEPKTGKLYAIKTLNQQMQLRDDFAAQQVKFINEAIKIASFDHKHIVKVHEVIEEVEVIEEDKFQLFGVVMEYIDGVTLFKYVQNKGQLSESEALLYINQISQALEYIHAKGSLHRDIKPENILLRQNQQEAVLIDFGSTRSMANTSMTISLTEGYAPIEQYRDKGNFGPHTDVYALAATLYYLLTADGLKRDSKSTPAPAYKREQIKTFDFLVKPKVYNQSLSQRVNDAILQGMELEPENRTPTVLKFRENLGLVNLEKEQEIQLKSEVGINYTKLPKQPNISAIELLNSHLRFQSLQSRFFDNNLSSERGIDYTKLRDLLAAKKWKEADYETYLVMLKAVGSEKDHWIGWEELLNFPCTDLCTIDKLWYEYSNGKFGFSVQKEIYLSVGGIADGNYYEEAWKKMGGKVGWRRKGKGKAATWIEVEDIIYTIEAPKGHLPVFGWIWALYGVWEIVPWSPSMCYSSLASRLVNCNI
jgi:eukaryotic-like serine/threonine-protein kinase